ncbi:hypothetical protein O6H91_15G076900 [Diphasiastrum complanatum]|nr:hypothetical protein O6H91_15G076900 [Diphasiastrum complanatum]
MDGNRRFASRSRIDKRSGHVLGYERLIQTLDSCLKLGVKIVTVYAFSIENFQRSPAEVSDLMELLQDKLDHLVSKEQLVRSYDVQVRILGDLSLLPKGVRESAERAMLATNNNKSTVLNVCIAYTSTHEIVQAIQKIMDERTQDQPHDKFITKEEIDRNLYTGLCPPPDILLRTSGETRLSNYLLWQCSNSYMCFCNALWPEFSFWHLSWMILKYQRAYPFLPRQQRPSF